MGKIVTVSSMPDGKGQLTQGKYVGPEIVFYGDIAHETGRALVRVGKKDVAGYMVTEGKE